MVLATMVWKEAASFPDPGFGSTGGVKGTGSGADMENSLVRSMGFREQNAEGPLRVR
jgi:hypothetical protein